MSVKALSKRLNMGNLAETTGELVQLLKKLPPDTPLAVSDGDIGGYDVSQCNYVCVAGGAEKGVRLGHLEYKAFELYEKGHLTADEAREFAGGD